MTESAKMKLRKNGPKKSKLTWTKIFNITIFLLSIIILMVNSESGGIWLLELTNSKLTSQLDSPGSFTNEKGMVTTNITFLLARKFDMGKTNHKARHQQTILGTNSDFWSRGEKRTVWKPGLDKENKKKGIYRQKVGYNKSWGSGGRRGKAYSKKLGQTGQAKLARSNTNKSHITVRVKCKSCKEETWRVKLAKRAVDRAQSKKMLCQ